MTEALVRRGPDDEGIHWENEVGLGMRRLSIIDVHGSKQPLRSESRRFTAVFNGEIYNFRELRAELQTAGFQFRTQGDGEVIVNLYEHVGAAAFARLRGMFAVAIWDHERHELVLARDPLGIKPLFYSDQGQALVFGSEIKSLLPALPKSLDIDAGALDAYLAYTYIPAPLTVWKCVRKLPPGHFLTWSHGRMDIKRYWDLLDAAGQPAPTSDELQAALDESIAAHLVSDVEVGAFLSGGLDSSTIVSRMQANGNDRTRAFSVRFDEKSHLFDETGYARELSERYGFNLHTETLPVSGYDTVTDAIRAFDEPFADDSMMPSNAICELASKHLKVVLAGAGGDEIFGGYNRYSGVMLHGRLTRLPGMVVNGLFRPAFRFASLLAGRSTRRGDLLERFSRGLSLDQDAAYRDYITSMAPEARKELFAPDLHGLLEQEQTIALIGNHQERGSELSPLKRAMYVDLNTYLPEDVLALSDRIGMWHSLEIRTPLADKVLAEFAFGIPTHQLISMSEQKIALRNAVRDWLPPGILKHRKQGFEGPTAAWLRRDGAAHVRRSLANNGKLGLELIRPAVLDRLLQSHVSGKADRAKSIFACLALLEWASINHGRIRGVA